MFGTAVVLGASPVVANSNITLTECDVAGINIVVGSSLVVASNTSLTEKGDVGFLVEGGASLKDASIVVGASVVVDSDIPPTDETVVDVIALIRSSLVEGLLVSVREEDEVITVGTLLEVDLVVTLREDGVVRIIVVVGTLLVVAKGVTIKHDVTGVTVVVGL